MSVKAALAFMARCETDAELRAALEKLKRTGADLEAVVTLGRRFGHVFGPEELRTAHEKDWHMRQAFYAGAARKVSES